MTNPQSEFVTQKDAPKIADAASWRDFYRAAIFEPDPNKLSERILEAQFALAAHARELLYATGDDVQERESVDNAMRILQILGSSLKPHAPSAQGTSDFDRLKTA